MIHRGAGFVSELRIQEQQPFVVLLCQFIGEVHDCGAAFRTLNVCVIS